MITITKKMRQDARYWSACALATGEEFENNIIEKKDWNRETGELLADLYKRTVEIRHMAEAFEQLYEALVDATQQSTSSCNDGEHHAGDSQ